MLTKILEWTKEYRAREDHAAADRSQDGGYRGSAPVRVDREHAHVEPAGVAGPTGEQVAVTAAGNARMPSEPESRTEVTSARDTATSTLGQEWKPPADSPAAGAAARSLLPESVLQRISELGSEQSRDRLSARYEEFRRRLSAMQSAVQLIDKQTQMDAAHQPPPDIQQAKARLESVDAWLTLQEAGLRAGFFPLVTYLQTNHVNIQSVQDRIGTDLQVSLQMLSGDDAVFSRRLDEVVEKLRPVLGRLNRRRSGTEPKPEWLEHLAQAIELKAFHLDGARDLDIGVADPGDDERGGAIAAVLAPGYYYQDKVLLRARVQRSGSLSPSNVGSVAS